MIEDEVKEIDKITFGILSPDDIRAMSVCALTTHKLSGIGSVYDERMGPMEKGKMCVSCGKSAKDCPGHFGHIELNQYIIHPLYYKIIANFLKCFCCKCYKFLFTEDHLKLDELIKYKRELRLVKILEKIENTDICCHCSSPQPKIFFAVKECNLYMVYKTKEANHKILLTPDEIKKIFDNVPDDDIRLLGFNPEHTHPKNLIFSVFPVLPPKARPFILADGMVCDDDLTLQICEIIKVNNYLKDENLPETKFQKYLQTLKFRIKCLFDNSKGRAKHTNGQNRL